MFILWMLSRNYNFSRFEVRIGGQLNDDRKNLKDSSTPVRIECVAALVTIVVRLQFQALINKWIIIPDSGIA